MKIEIRHNGEDKSINIGHIALVAAAEKLRELRREAFQEATPVLAKETSESAQLALTESVQSFMRWQIPNDQDVGEFLRCWAGRRSALLAAMRKIEPKMTEDEADAFLDAMEDGPMNAFLNAIEALLEGSRFTDLYEKRLALNLEGMKLTLQQTEDELNHRKRLYELERQKMDDEYREKVTLASSGSADTPTTDAEQTPPIPA